MEFEQMKLEAVRALRAIRRDKKYHGENYLVIFHGGEYVFNGAALLILMKSVLGIESMSCQMPGTARFTVSSQDYEVMESFQSQNADVILPPPVELACLTVEKEIPKITPKGHDALYELFIQLLKHLGFTKQQNGRIKMSIPCNLIQAKDTRVSFVKKLGELTKIGALLSYNGAAEFELCTLDFRKLQNFAKARGFEFSLKDERAAAPVKHPHKKSADEPLSDRMIASLWPDGEYERG